MLKSLNPFIFCPESTRSRNRKKTFCEDSKHYLEDCIIKRTKNTLDVTIVQGVLLKQHIYHLDNKKLYLTRFFFINYTLNTLVLKSPPVGRFYVVKRGFYLLGRQKKSTLREDPRIGYTYSYIYQARK